MMIQLADTNTVIIHCIIKKLECYNKIWVPLGSYNLTKFMQNFHSNEPLSKACRATGLGRNLPSHFITGGYLYGLDIFEPQVSRLKRQVGGFEPQEATQSYFAQIS